jgi:O-antigen/teichoic acid export membrane protein
MNLFKSFIKFSFGSWISAGVSFFTTPVVTLLIMPEEFGKAAMFTLTSGILLQIVLLGGDQSFMRFFYEKNNDKRSALLWNSIYPAIVVWGIVSVILLFFWQTISFWLISDSHILVVILLSINLLVSIFQRYSFLVIRMQKKGTFFSIQQIIQSILNVTFVICFCYFVSKSFYALLFATIFATLFAAIISIAVERKFWLSSLLINKKIILEILKYGLPFVPACLIAIFFEGIDKIFLRRYTGFEELGIYVAAFRIIALLNIVRTGFSTFWAPISFEHYEKSPNDTTLYEKMFRYILFIVTIVGLIVIAFKDVIILLFAQNYRESASIMPFLIFIPILYTLTEISCLGIYFKKKSGWQLFVFCILLICSTMLNYLLTPLLGAKGTALATALSYLVYFYLRTTVSVKLYPMDFQLFKTTFSFLLLFVVAGVNTFINNKIIGISCACIATLVYLLFHLATIKDIIIYFNQIVADIQCRMTK